MTTVSEKVRSSATDAYPVWFGHANVEQNGVEGFLAQRFQRRTTFVEGHYLITATYQQPLQHFADELFVIDH